MDERFTVLNYQTLEGGSIDDMGVAMSEAKRLTMKGILHDHLPYSETAVSDDGEMEYSIAVEITKNGNNPEHIKEVSHV